MRPSLLKIKLIYLRGLLVAAAYLIIYSFLTWLFVYKFAVLSLNEDLVSYWLPGGLSIAIILLWIAPRVKLLKLQRKKADLPGLYFFLGWIALSAPVVLFQKHMETATGVLTTLNKVSELSGKDLTKYYKIKQHYVDKLHPAIYRKAEVSGKNDQYLTFYIYVACPVVDNKQMVDSTARQLSRPPVAWLGVKYSKQISNSVSDAEKDQAFKDLIDNAEQQFRAADLDDLVYLNRMGNNNARKAYYHAVASVLSNEAQPVVFEAKKEPFEDRNGNYFEWTLGSFGIGTIVWLMMCMLPGLEPYELSKLQAKQINCPRQSIYLQY
ncbi:hypothetical protein DYU05_07065 [Mucilaginibacter terrenus]|uniref:Uncharacterized protein n=1 Tax=Mucilaginibacter terrenus TaxID=2482727 RepID=A0A3E2NWQ2_9SPHI|nr:hypothetical protein [Mucilaginibacter terrenus]RFZ85351.1 hypothetical protein DYU05_07065 [Mucilaginibacter terrenus]